VQADKIVRRQHLALQDREVLLDQVNANAIDWTRPGGEAGPARDEVEHRLRT
jgi:hypothetical protein